MMKPDNNMPMRTTANIAMIHGISLRSRQCIYLPPLNQFPLPAAPLPSHALEFFRDFLLRRRLFQRHEFTRCLTAFGPGAGAGQRGLQLRALLHRALAGVVTDRPVYPPPCLRLHGPATVAPLERPSRGRRSRAPSGDLPAR